MKQVPVTSSSGMFTRFNITRVLKISELNNNQLLRAFDTLRVDEIHHELSLAVVETSIKKTGGKLRQMNILKGVLVSEEYFTDQVIANPAVAPFIKEFLIVDDFLLPEDRFSRLLQRLAPTQTKTTTNHTVGVGGLVTVGVPFVDATLTVSPGTNVPTLVNGADGEVTFPLGDIGDFVTLTYVTELLHPIFKIRRMATNPPIAELLSTNETQAVLLNATLADLLGITLPTI